MYHRDVSSGNVMMKESKAVTGVLNDWDHAQRTDAKRSRRVVRAIFVYILIVSNAVS